MTTRTAYPDPKIESLLKELEAKHEAAGTSVRCPVCDAGIGKWCLKGMDKETHVRVIHRTADQIIIHEERVALANAR